MIDYVVNNKYRSSVKDVKCLLSMEGQEESKIQKEIETMEVERNGDERRVC